MYTVEDFITGEDGTLLRVDCNTLVANIESHHDAILWNWVYYNCMDTPNKLAKELMIKVMPRAFGFLDGCDYEATVSDAVIEVRLVNAPEEHSLQHDALALAAKLVAVNLNGRYSELANEEILWQVL